MKDNKDRDEVLAAVKEDGWALEHADESLQKDKEIVMAAVKQDGYALDFADESLQKDKEIVMVAVKQFSAALDFADESLKKDKEIVMVVVKQDGSNLDYADESLKKNREIVLAAVKQDGEALQYADESLKKNREIVLAAVKQDGSAIMHADESLQKDREFLLAVVKENGEALEYADQLKLRHDEDNEDELLKKDKRIAMAAISTLKKGKRRFRIDAGNYGGELVVGTVDEAFIQDFDPELLDDWYEVDDIVHRNCCYSDSGFSWCEVPVDGSDDYDDFDMKELEAHHLYDRETFHEPTKPNEDDIKEGDEWIPVLAYCSSSKGNHGCWFVETNNEDFDPKKVAFSSVDTNVASIVEDVWYDKKKLDHDSTWMDSTHKGNDAEVGWMNLRMHDTLESIQANIEDYWDY